MFSCPSLIRVSVIASRWSTPLMSEDNSVIPLGGPLVPEQDRGSVINLGSQTITVLEDNESYFQLVWRRFRRSKVSIVGAAMVVVLVMLAAFADFFSPTPIDQPD